MEMKLKLVLFLLFLATPTWSTRCRAKSFECRVNDPKFVQIELCTLKVIGRRAKVINTFIKLLQIPVTNITVRGELRRRGYDRPALYSFTIDACRFLDAKHRNPIASIIYKLLSFADHSNMNHSCPYDHDLILKNVRLDESVQLPWFLSPGDYKMVTYWHAYNVLRVTTIIVIESA